MNIVEQDFKFEVHLPFMKKTEHQSVRQGEATFTLQRDGTQHRLCFKYGKQHVAYKISKKSRVSHLPHEKKFVLLLGNATKIMFFYPNQITDNIKLFIHQLEEAIRLEQQRDMNIRQTKPNTIPEIRPEGLGIKAETPSELSNSIEASNEDIIAYHTRSKSRMSNNTSETVDASQTTSNPSLSSTFQANSLQIYHTYCSKRRKTLEGSKDVHYHAEESSHHLYFPDGNQDYELQEHGHSLSCSSANSSFSEDSTDVSSDTDSNFSLHSNNKKSKKKNNKKHSKKQMNASSTAMILTSQDPSLLMNTTNTVTINTPNANTSNGNGTTNKEKKKMNTIQSYCLSPKMIPIKRNRERVGFLNLGNTCYMNVIIVSLMSIPRFMIPLQAFVLLSGDAELIHTFLFSSSLTSTTLLNSPLTLDAEPLNEDPTTPLNEDESLHNSFSLPPPLTSTHHLDSNDLKLSDPTTPSIHPSYSSNNLFSLFTKNDAALITPLSTNDTLSFFSANNNNTNTNTPTPLLTPVSTPTPVSTTSNMSMSNIHSSTPLLDSIVNPSDLPSSNQQHLSTTKPIVESSPHPTTIEPKTDEPETNQNLNTTSYNTLCSKTPLFYSFLQLYKIHLVTHLPISPVLVKQSLTNPQFHQNHYPQDAHEFLLYIIGQLEDELLELARHYLCIGSYDEENEDYQCLKDKDEIHQVINEIIHSLITSKEQHLIKTLPTYKCFSTIVQNTIDCNQCHHKKSTYETYSNFSLNIDEVFLQQSNTEPLNIHCSYYSNYMTKSTTHSESATITTPPTTVPTQTMNGSLNGTVPLSNPIEMNDNSTTPVSYDYQSLSSLFTSNPTISRDDYYNSFVHEVYDRFSTKPPSEELSKDPSEIISMHINDPFWIESDSTLGNHNNSRRKKKKEHDILLDFIIKSAFLPESLMFTCDCCQCKTHTFRSVITDIAPILIFQLKRYSYDSTSNTFKKINLPIRIPKYIDMSPYMLSSSSPTLYKIRSIIYHKSTTYFGGHYYCDICNDQNQWERWDDAIKTSLTEDEIFTNDDTFIYSYVLIYEQV